VTAKLRTPFKASPGGLSARRDQMQTVSRRRIEYRVPKGPDSPDEYGNVGHVLRSQRIQCHMRRPADGQRITEAMGYNR